MQTLLSRQTGSLPPHSPAKHCGCGLTLLATACHANRAGDRSASTASSSSSNDGKQAVNRKERREAAKAAGFLERKTPPLSERDSASHPSPQLVLASVAVKPPPLPAPSFLPQYRWRVFQLSIPLEEDGGKVSRWCQSSPQLPPS